MDLTFYNIPSNRKDIIVDKNKIKALKQICPKLDESCVEKVKERCPDLDNECLTQMDYYLVGRENFPDTPISRREYFDNEYFKLCETVIKNGKWQRNARTGKNCLTYMGAMMKFDMENTDCFPLLTTKKMAYTPMIGELLGFIRGYDNAAQFRELGCNIWDANANKSKHWLDNPNRVGEDDLGRIYGVQAREWRGLPDGFSINSNTPFKEIDQLQNVIEKIVKRIDDRRLIVSHWNPSELNQMALPPCHLLYQFGIINNTLHLCMYQRSADIPLGVPFNIASYALLLKLVAKISGLECGSFTHFLANAHIYEDQLDDLYTQLERNPRVSPELEMPEIYDLEDLETWVIPDNFKFKHYDPHPAIKFKFSK